MKPITRLPIPVMKALRFATLIALGTLAFTAFAAGMVDLRRGTVELPGGFTHTRDKGKDSTVGHFTSADGSLTIHYDIGKMAGVQAKATDLKDIVSSESVKAGDLDALIVVHGAKPRKIVISFPGGGPANFFAEVRGDEDIAMVRKLVLTFKLKPLEPGK